MQAFEAAILEFDAARFPEKLTHARHAILDRIEELHGVNAANRSGLTCLRSAR